MANAGPAAGAGNLVILLSFGMFGKTTDGEDKPILMCRSLDIMCISSLRGAEGRRR